MNLDAALALGLLQGVVEWLPISSQGSLLVAMIGVFGMDPSDALRLSVHLHLGTWLASIIYFRRDVVRALPPKTEADRRMFRFLAAATAATGVVGLPLFLLVQTISAGEVILALTGAALIATGLVEKGAARRGGRSEESLSSWLGLALGLVQGVSALPGASRSGLTASALLLLGFSGGEALRVSFLMGIPATLAAVVGLAALRGAPEIGPGYLGATAVSFFTSLLVIDLLLRAVRGARFWILCVALGALTLSAQLLRLL